MGERGESEFILDPAEYERLLFERYQLAITFVCGLPSNLGLASTYGELGEGEPNRARLLQLGEQLAYLLDSDAVASPTATAPLDSEASTGARAQSLVQLVTGIVGDQRTDGEIRSQILEIDPCQRAALAEIVALLVGGDTESPSR